MSGCGCKSGIDKRGREWIEFCATHEAEHDEIHTRWRADLLRRRTEEEERDSQRMGNTE
jgi:hypothetical protein